MIFLIIMIVLSLGLLAFIIWDLIANSNFHVYHVVFICFIMAFISAGIAFPLSHSSLVNEEKYNELTYVYEHFDELSAYEQKEANEDFKEWNKNLQNNNNLLMRFKIEDISEYIFEIKELKTQAE